MTRALVLGAVLALPALLAGCGGSGAPAPPVPRAADAQHADLDWSERAGLAGAGLVFRVTGFDVTRTGWSASVSVRNDTATAFTISGSGEPLGSAFGLMVFGSGAHTELERRNASLTLPSLRPATGFRPALPASLRPRASWSGTMSAPGALPAGSWVRLVFGAFVPSGSMPAGLRQAGVVDSVVWISDHAYRLRR